MMHMLTVMNKYDLRFTIFAKDSHVFIEQMIFCAISELNRKGTQHERQVHIRMTVRLH